MPTPIAILLATYNGARFLPAQLASLVAQTHGDWHLYARDDGSVDGTRACLAAFAAAHPRRMTLVCDGAGRLGARGNFAALMAWAEEPYFAFADQDDVWRPTKLHRALAQMQRLEADAPAGTPAMVHADRAITDAAGRVLAASYWASRGISPANFQTLEAHFPFCLAAGATMLINRPLSDLALPIPSAARMHDCWIELVAHAFGAVAALDEVALDHRRHGANASGAARDIDSPATRRPMARALRLFGALDVHRNVCRVYFEQAAAFRARYGDKLTADAVLRLDAFLSLPRQRMFGRLQGLVTSRAAPPGLARALAFLMLSGRRPKYPRPLTRETQEP